MNSRISRTAVCDSKVVATSSTTFHQRPLLREQQTVRPAQGVDVLAGEAAALQADDVETGEVGAVAEHHAVGNAIVLQPGKAADEGMRADAGELDHRRAAAEDGVVAHGAVPASITLFENTTCEPTLQSCPTCEFARKAQ